MKLSAPLNLLGQLAKCVFKCEACHHIYRILICLPIFVLLVTVWATGLAHNLLLFKTLFYVLLVAIDKKLFIKSRVHGTCLIKFIECLLLLIQFINEEVGILYPESGAVGKLLDAHPIHILGMLQQQLIIVLLLCLRQMLVN